MARFNFKLEAVLEARQRAEKERQRELAEKAAAVTQCEKELHALDDQVKSATEDVRDNRLTGKLDLAFLAAHRRFLGAMQKQAMGIVQRLTLASQKAEESRLKLADAAKQRKVIEKLRERQLDRWRVEQSRKELADLDEIGAQIAFTNLSESAAVQEGES